MRIHWVEDFAWAHQGGGEVHCTTNAFRDISADRSWWRAPAEADTVGPTG
ncbi:protein-arginine deiminase (PAD) [Herbihabitans rhizosphaerae]|uniref:Protein-arginine deiminase (PAD) n=1 Tax=Herbihabitans rhizosphaerae TaxID=1872711 RepID=A0A4Q7L5E4_9PSEU|nr:protein-arginine deiminase (PAD) [Herbihabitans rhizosphaerae]